MILRQYQKDLIQRWQRQPKLGWAVEMGLGKTLAALQGCVETLEVSRTLVVAPKRVVAATWPREAEILGLPRPPQITFEHLDLVRTPKPKTGLVFRDKKTTKATICRIAAEWPIVLVSYDALTYVVAALGPAGSPWDTVILDESTFVKSGGRQGAVRWKAAKLLAAQAERVLLLTGTPMVNSYEDLWGQTYLIDEGKSLGRTLTEFRQTWLAPENAHMKWSKLVIRSAQMEAEIMERMKLNWVSLRADDWLELPPYVYNDVMVEMPADARAVVDGIMARLAPMLEGHAIIPPNAAAAINKALQVCDGSAYVDDFAPYVLALADSLPITGRRIAARAHTAKRDALAEILEQTVGGVVLFYAFTHSRPDIIAGCQDAGGVVFIEADHAQEDWIAGKFKVLAMHPASGAHGLNLQAGGHTVVWYGLTWNLEHYIQGNARLRRSGQENDRVIVHRLTTGHAVEQAVADALDGKGSLLDGLMRAIAPCS